MFDAGLHDHPAVSNRSSRSREREILRRHQSPGSTQEHRDQVAEALNECGAGIRGGSKSKSEAKCTVRFYRATLLWTGAHVRAGGRRLRIALVVAALRTTVALGPAAPSRRPARSIAPPHLEAFVCRMNAATRSPATPSSRPPSSRPPSPPPCRALRFPLPAIPQAVSSPGGVSPGRCTCSGSPRSSALSTQQKAWLYWHQVVTGWTALALLAAALVFAYGPRWRWSYLPLLSFPRLVVRRIYRIDAFRWAAGPGSPSSAWRRSGPAGSSWPTAGAWRRAARRSWAPLLLWGLHHLDYPFLRRAERGPHGATTSTSSSSWPWAPASCCSSRRPAPGSRRAGAALRGPPAARPGARPARRAPCAPADAARGAGAAMYLLEGSPGRFVPGVGVCAGWSGTIPADASARVLAEAAAAGRPTITAEWLDPLTLGTAPYTSQRSCPSSESMEVTGALVTGGRRPGPIRGPGSEDFLVALGRRVGAAPGNANPYERLQGPRGSRSWPGSPP